MNLSHIGMRIFILTTQISLSSRWHGLLLDLKIFSTGLRNLCRARPPTLYLRFRVRFNPDIKLLSYQQSAAHFARERHAPYLALYMGGGKTFTSLSLVDECEQVLIVCPVYLKSHWEMNIKYCYPQDSDRFTILPYSRLRKKDTQEIQTYFSKNPKGNKAIIFDEAHYLKTSTAQRTKAVYGAKGLIGVPFNKFIFLSGTPISKSPLDLYPYLKKFANEDLKKLGVLTKEDYIIRYCGGKLKVVYIYGHRRTLLLPTGRTNVEEFAALCANYIFHVGPKEIEKDLPSISHEIIVTNASGVKQQLLKIEKNYYNVLHNAINDKLISNAPGFTEYSEIRKLIALEKLKAILPDLSDYISQTANTVIFCWHREVGELLKEYFKTPYYIAGHVAVETRDSLISQFNESSGGVLVGQIKSCSTGISLTSADTAIFVELPWDPLDIEQAFKRLHRSTQTARVKVLYFALNNSVDIEVLNVLRDKVEFLNYFYKNLNNY